MPSWLTIVPTPPGNLLAGTSAATFTVAAATGCGGFAVNTSRSATLHLVNLPAPDRTLPVTLQIVPQSPLVVAPVSSITYVKNSPSPGSVSVNVGSVSGSILAFTVDTTSLPMWLTVDSLSGVTPGTLHFSTTAIADSLSPGTYSATIRIKANGSGDLPVPISLLVSNAASSLTIAGAKVQDIFWTVGQTIPSAIITAVSSDLPIPFTVTIGGSLGLQVPANLQSGQAYSYGTLIPVSFSPAVFATAQPGATLTGTVTLNWGNGNATPVTFNVTVLAPAASLTAIVPASLPTALPSAVFYVALSGSGFVSSNDAAQSTLVGIVSGGVITPNVNISPTVINASSIILKITVPDNADPALPFAPGGSGGSLVLGVCNPQGSSCSVPSGSATLTIANGPIVQAVTSASSFLEVTPPANPKVAPYDMISIFGANLCASSGVSCNIFMAGVADPLGLRYPPFLSPDPVSATQRLLTVTFQTHAASPTTIATAPLLFATNEQINLVAPGGLSAYVGGTVDVVVSFGYGSGATVLRSQPFPVNVQATDPGIFTMTPSGQGSGAILGANSQLVGFGGSEAGMRTSQTDSDIVQIYTTGLGVPDSLADNASSTGAYNWSADCISMGSYLTTLNAQALTAFSAMDGIVVQPALVNSNRLPPCLTSSSQNKPTVTIGGVAGIVKYAGWVNNSIAGLYQVNVQLPSRTGVFTDYLGNTLTNITAPTQLPVVITSNKLTSQAGVNIWVAPRLKVLPPTAPAGLAGTVGVPWNNGSAAGAGVSASQGTGSYQYQLSGLLPDGLNLDPNSGVIFGTPSAGTAGTYVVSVIVTDAAVPPVSGTTVPFTLTIQGGLVVTPTNTTATTFGTGGTLAQMTVAGESDPVTYTITSPSGVPGLAIGTLGNVYTSDTTPAGSYLVTVHAVDATNLTGNATFPVVVGLLTSQVPIALNGTLNQTGGSIATVGATGDTGTITYVMDPTSYGLGFRVSSSGVVSISAASVAALNIMTGSSQQYTVVVTATGVKPAGATAGGSGIISVVVTITNP
jgi:uncharacterized protein (TIGR03437 family)